MTDRKTIGIVVTILGAVMTCCLCPLAIDVMVAWAGRGGGLYARLVTRGGVRMLQAMQYLRSGQIICVGVLALAVLVVGIVTLAQARNVSSDEKKA